MNNAAIALFDSGVGGLSIWQEVRKLMPHENLIYFADQAFCPYGNKSAPVIKSRVKFALDFLRQQQVKLIVIACNTATTVGIDDYRSHLPEIPIVGIVPVVKTAVAMTQTKKVMVMATEATIRSHYLDVLIGKFGKGVTFFKLSGGADLVNFVEAGDLKSEILKTKLQKLFSPFVDEEIDVVVLGCTHYPFLKEVIAASFPNEVTILDSGAAVSRQVQRILTEKQETNYEGIPNYRFFTTQDPEQFQEVARSLLNYPNIIASKVEGV